MASDSNDLNPLLDPPDAAPSERRRALKALFITGLFLLFLAPISLFTFSGTFAGFLGILAVVFLTTTYLFQRGLASDRWKGGGRPLDGDQHDKDPMLTIDLGLRDSPPPINLPIGPGRSGYDAVEDLLEGGQDLRN